MRGGGFWGTDHGDGNYTQWLNDTEYDQFEDEYMYRGQFTGRKANIAAGITAGSNVNESMNPKLPRGPGKGFGDFMTLHELTVAQTQKIEGKADVSDISGLEAQQHGMPFYFRDMRTNQLLVFRAFLEGLTESITPDWNEEVYVGRSEPVYMYERAERDLSFNLRVYPNNETEFNMMYEKIEYLTSLAYPEYFPNDPNASLIRMQPPFTELYMAHIGSRKQGQFGFIKSITYTVNESGDWDALQALPRLFDIAITYQILSKRPPSLSSDHKFYRLGA